MVLVAVPAAIASIAVIAFLGTVTIPGTSRGLEITPTIITTPLALAPVIVVEYFCLTVVIALLVSIPPDAWLDAGSVCPTRPVQNVL